MRHFPINVSSDNCKLLLQSLKFKSAAIIIVRYEQ